MRLRLTALAALLVCGVPLTASAIPVTYGMQFTVTSGTVVATTLPQGGGVTVVESDATGRTYFGQFTVDDAILASDGIGKTGNVSSFFIRMEDNVWAYGTPDDNSFDGFRGPNPNNPACGFTCFNVASPGFDVVGGTITNLHGGVYGTSDAPYVDFSPGGLANTFTALGLTIFTPGTTFTRVNGVHGAMAIYKVSEPGALLVLSLGLLSLAFAARRRFS
jgi:hypothetical protein